MPLQQHTRLRLPPPPPCEEMSRIYVLEEVLVVGLIMINPLPTISTLIYLLFISLSVDMDVFQTRHHM